MRTPDCHPSRQYAGRGLCTTCYPRERRKRLGLPRSYGRRAKMCVIASCDRIAIGRAECNTHRLRRQQGIPTCAAPGCDRPGRPACWEHRPPDRLHGPGEPKPIVHVSRSGKEYTYDYRVARVSRACPTCGTSFESTANGRSYCRDRCNPSTRAARRRRKAWERGARIIGSYDRDLILCARPVAMRHLWREG